MPRTCANWNMRCRSSRSIFSKPPSSLLASGGEIVRPKLSQRVDYEGELGFVIGRRCHKMKDGESAKDYILGYTIVNDVTARDLQKHDGQWTRCKGFDTFCPFGPVVNTELDPWSGVQVQTRVNGQLRQDGNTRDMMFSMDRILHYISQFCTLLPGDLIATGTPEGVGPLHERRCRRGHRSKASARCAIRWWTNSVVSEWLAPGRHSCAA